MADYYPLIARAVAGLDKNTGDARRALYERARASLVSQLRGDVVLIGNAYSPGGAPVQRLVARLSVGEVDKAIEVWCDRTLRADGSVVNGPFFTHLPLLSGDWPGRWWLWR